MRHLEFRQLGQERFRASVDIAKHGRYPDALPRLAAIARIRLKRTWADGGFAFGWSDGLGESGEGWRQSLGVSSNSGLLLVPRSVTVTVELE
jgi:hypothetical protein